MDKKTSIRKPKSLRIQRMHLGSHLILCLWSLIVLFPIYVMIVSSFKDRLSIYVNTFGLPETWNFSNYTDILSSGEFMVYFRNTFVVVITSLALLLIIGSLAAYALAQWRGRWSNIIYFFFIAGMMMPLRIASIRLLEITRFLGTLDTVWSLPPVYIAMGLPIAIFVLTEFIRQIPRDLLEAAYIDGASRLSVLVRIIAPLLRPALATITIYNLIPFWNDLWFPLIFITDVDSRTLMLGVTQLFGQYQTDWSRVMAVLTLSSLPVMILYMLLSKHFVKGMTAGAIKG